MTKREVLNYLKDTILATINDDEKRAYSITELNLRVQVLIDNLSGMGIKATELNTAGILELMYSTYHKDDYTNFENLLTGEYTTLLTGFDIFKDEFGRNIPYIEMVWMKVVKKYSKLFLIDLMNLHNK